MRTTERMLAMPLMDPVEAEDADAADPGTTIYVSTTGDDTNDGFAQPVKTLKHASGVQASGPRQAAATKANSSAATIRNSED